MSHYREKGLLMMLFNDKKIKDYSLGLKLHNSHLDPVRREQLCFHTLWCLKTSYESLKGIHETI